MQERDGEDGEEEGEGEFHEWEHTPLRYGVKRRMTGGMAESERTAAVTIRLTEPERSLLEAQAQADGRTLSDWIRRALGLRGVSTKKERASVDRRRKTA